MIESFLGVAISYKGRRFHRYSQDSPLLLKSGPISSLTCSRTLPRAQGYYRTTKILSGQPGVMIRLKGRKKGSLAEELSLPEAACEALREWSFLSHRRSWIPRDLESTASLGFLRSKALLRPGFFVRQPDGHLVPNVSSQCQKIGRQASKRQ